LLQLVTVLYATEAVICLLSATIGGPTPKRPKGRGEFIVDCIWHIMNDGPMVEVLEFSSAMHDECDPLLP
jgi:hypothetical protein